MCRCVTYFIYGIQNALEKMLLMVPDSRKKLSFLRYQEFCSGYKGRGGLYPSTLPKAKVELLSPGLSGFFEILLKRTPSWVLFQELC